MYVEIAVIIFYLLLSLISDRFHLGVGSGFCGIAIMAAAATLAGGR